MKIGILGGTFDPIHQGHLDIAQQALMRFQLDHIDFIPCFQSPHRNKPIASPMHRMEMVKRAIASHPQFTLNDIEMQRHEISYSIDTLLLLKKLNPHHHYYFIVGMDAFLQFDRWREWQHIISLCDIIIVSRHKKEMAIPPLVKTFLKKENREHHIHYLLIDPIAISATHIRADIAAKKQLIPGMIDSVREYILENEIYRV